MVEHVRVGDGHKNEPEECRKQRETSAHRLEQLVQNQRNGDIACTQDQLGDAAENIELFCGEHTRNRRQGRIAPHHAGGCYGERNKEGSHDNE